jgi:hypothetical protein
MVNRDTGLAGEESNGVDEAKRAPGGARVETRRNEKALHADARSAFMALAFGH